MQHLEHVRYGEPVAAPSMRRWSGSAATWSATALLALGLVGLWYAHTRQTASELQALPSAERSALYGRTHETLRTTCSRTSTPNLMEYCREQARFLVQFPECDGDCRALARQFEPRPTR